MSVKITICDATAEDIDLLSSTLPAYDPLFEITTFTSGKTLVNEFLDDGFNNGSPGISQWRKTPILLQ